MIELRYIDNLSCAVAICDECGEQISDGKGRAVWDWTGREDGGPVSYELLHHGCDAKRHAEERQDPLWEEFGTFLSHLAANSGSLL